MRIAHFGTFDVENYGDLLFPLILERRFSDICEEFVHVSPVGGPPVWGDCVPSLAAGELLRGPSNVDGVIIGGGHIIRSSRSPLKGYDDGAFSSYFAYPSLWLGAAYAAARDNLPLCWNAPGVTEPFSQISSRLARWTVSVSDYVSIRDKESQLLLQRAGVDQQVEVVPDTGIEVARLWSKEAISEAYGEAFADRRRSVPERTIAFHLTRRWVTESAEVTAARLDRISQRFAASPILIAIGPCHGDSELQRRVAEHMSTEPLVIDHPRSLREVTACIARSEAYVGSSMHGMITACSFGKRGLLVASPDEWKFTGFLEHFHLSPWLSETWEEAERRTDELFSAPKEAWERVLDTATPMLDQHWARVREVLKAPYDDRTDPQTAHKVAALERLHDINRDYSGEGGIFQGIVVENLKKSQDKLQTRVDSLERKLDSTRQELDTAKRKLGSTRQELDTAKRKLDSTRQELDTTKQSLTETARSRQKLKEGLAELAKSRERLLEAADRKDRRIAHLSTRNALEAQKVDRLLGWMEEINAATAGLLGSRRWRASHALGEIYRQLRRRPREPTPAERLTEVLRRVDASPISSTSLPAGSRTANGMAIPAKPQELKPKMTRAELPREIRRRLGPVPKRTEWPKVSIIVLNRNGLDHLKKLLAGLRDHTDYPDFEVVLVDNGSTDGSVEFIRSFEAAFPVRLIAKRNNVSFSAGCNQGAREASGDLLLFLNNDVEPIEDGWLRQMVDCLDSHPQAGAVGARLLYAEGGRDTNSGYAVQQRGVKFRQEQGFAHYFNLGAGDDALGEDLGDNERCPAVSAACLMIEREAFDSVGGFDTGYRYGTEDVDLGLKLLISGRESICCNRAVLLHAESSSQDAAGNAFKRINRTGNRQLFRERWGPFLHRSVQLDRLGSEGFWSDEGVHIAITVSSNDPNDGYGDWYTAHELGDALEKRGWRVSYVQRKNEEWYSLPEDLDYLLVMLDQYDISRVSGVTTIAWVRNWTNRWAQQPWFEHFDVVLVSSSISRELIERETTQKAPVLFPIATNPERFARTSTELTYEADCVFTGNYWGANRLLHALDIAPEETLMIFGKGWEKVPRAARYARGHLPYQELPRVYSSSKLVIDSGAGSTLPYGAVNSRVFDALATGTLVVTDCKTGVRELFDEDFPTYSSREEFRSQLDRLLGDKKKRTELANRYREIVLREHTYERRAEQLTELLRERIESLSVCVKIGAPDWEAAQSWGDLHFARALRKQFERQGHPCLIQVLDEWDNFEGLRYDVVIHLKGLTPYVPKPGQFNVLWNISHPDLVTSVECDKYDLVFVASEQWAARLKEETKCPVVVLEQATDPEVFFPDPSPEHEHELVFVGNSRRVHRRILRDLLPTKHDLVVWGGEWEEFIDGKYIAGLRLSQDQVRKAYSSAAIVLNDHWDDMRDHGFVSSRVYDALACGALVISDDLPELRERFGESVVTYRRPEELHELVDHYLASPQQRAEKGRLGRKLVLANHTFERRVETMWTAIARYLGEEKARNSRFFARLGALTALNKWA